MVQQLATLVDIKAGLQFRGSIPEDAGGNAFALQMRDIGADGAVAWAGLTRTSLAGYKSIAWLRPGDVVFVARGVRNYALCLDEVPLPTVCSQYFFLLRTRSPSLLPEFLAWQINRAPVQRYLATHAEGSAQLSIRRGVLEALPIVLPPVADQRRIVALAREAGRERQLLETMIRNRERQLDALAVDLHARQSSHR